MRNVTPEMLSVTTEIIVLDTETTGMDPTTAEVVQVGLRHGLGAVCKTRAWSIKPIRGMTAEATAVHGITDEMAAEWPVFAQVADQIAEAIGQAKVIVGYNPDYDITMLSAEFKRVGQRVQWPKTVICCKRLWDIHRPRPTRDLSAAYAQFVDPDGFSGAHGAVADMAATAQVCVAMLRAFDLSDKPWEEMDPERATWWGPSNHVVWSGEELLCNFGKNKGKPYRDLDLGMIRWISGQEFPPHVKRLGDFVISCKPRPTTQQLAFWARSAL